MDYGRPFTLAFKFKHNETGTHTHTRALALLRTHTIKYGRITREAHTCNSNSDKERHRRK